MATVTLNSLIEAIGALSANSSTMTHTEELLRDIGLDEYPKEWEDAVSAWELANPNVESSEDATRVKMMLAYDLHYSTGKIEAARGIWDAAEEHFEGMWSYHCKKLH